MSGRIAVVFFDTNVILDYLENRNKEVRDMIAQLLLFHRKGRVVLATSVFNMSELIDKEFQIQFIGECINERMSYDEIVGKVRRDRKIYRQIAEKNKGKVEKKVRDFIFGNKLEVLSVPFDDPEDYQELYNLIYNYQLESQDSLVVATAILSDVTYFLSNDSDLVNTIGDLINAYNLRDEFQRNSFRDDVLETLPGKSD